VDDRLLLDLWKAVRIGNPDISKEEFARIAQQNYYQKGGQIDAPANIHPRSIVRHLNRLLAHK
jgi:hypothetical protein